MLFSVTRQLSARLKRLAFTVSVILLISVVVFRPFTKFSSFAKYPGQAVVRKMLMFKPRARFPYSDFSKSLESVGYQFWDSMKPGFNCPSSELVRFGDGLGVGKWVCGLSTLAKQPNCSVYSFGVNDDSSFEADVMERTHCEVYAYDPTVEKIGKPLDGPPNGRVHFEKIGLGGEDVFMNGMEYRTLQSLMKRNGGHTFIDILKIDAEGAEYPGLEKLMQDYPPSSPGGLPFGQLLVEVHYNNTCAKVYKQTKELGRKLVDLFWGLEARGLRLYHFEKTPSETCCELCFININKLDRYLKGYDVM